jgi:UDP-N-acetylmuramate dehydrogenase
MVIEERIEKGVSLAPFTSFKIGGPAKYFVEVNTQAELIESIEWAKANQCNYFVLGGGSKLIVSDNGYDGLVIKNDCRLVEINKQAIYAESGVPLSLLVSMAKRHGLSGLEWAAGLPGTVGGSIRGNAGCFGSSMAEITVSVTVYDPETKKTEEIKTSAKHFEYRSSVFAKQATVILGAKLKLHAGEESEIEAKMQENVRYRVDHQPPYPSAGSVFKNVSLDYVKSCNKDLAKIAESEQIVRNGQVGAGWIIEKIHLKGKMMGGAMISLEHGNFIVNKSLEARAEDVVMLISFIKQQVRLVYNIHLVEEIIYLGF